MRTLVDIHGREVRLKQTKKDRASALALRCQDAYSFDRYESWTAVAAALLRHGLDERQAEAVMRSKWMRWAADFYESERGGRYGHNPAKAIIEFLKGVSDDDIEDMARWTFGPRDDE